MEKILETPGWFQRARSFVLRWQEKIILLPLLLIISFFAWTTLTVFDRTAGQDMLSQLVQLPILCMYAAAAMGLAWLARRRQRRRLTPEEQDAFWNLLLAGNKAAMIIFITDLIVWLTSFVTLLLFFWPKR